MTAAGPQPAELYTDSRTAPAFETLAEIDAEALDRFRRDGLLAVRRALAAAAVDAALAGLADLVDGAVPDYRGVQFEGPAPAAGSDARHLQVRKLMGFVDHEPRLRAVSADAGLLDVVRRLMDGREPELFRDMALLKPPGGREKPWHQDMACPPAARCSGTA